VIFRRIVLTLVLTLLAAVTIGVIVGLDESTRSNLASKLSNDPITSPSPEPVTSASGSPTAKPSKMPTPASTASRSPKPTSSAASTTPSTASPSTTRSSSPKPRTSASSSAKPKPTKSSTTKPKKGKVVYLTFDDGPSPYTPQILAILRATGSTATFFQLGVNRPGHDATIAAIKAQGSKIANHTYNHPNLTLQSDAEVQRQLRGGPKAKCFRPPYGATDARIHQAVNKAGMREVLWTVDTLDWQKPGVKAIQRVGKSRHVKNHGIILMHDGGGTREQTVAALPKLIKELQARGFKAQALPYC